MTDLQAKYQKLATEYSKVTVVCGSLSSVGVGLHCI